MNYKNYSHLISLLVSILNQGVQALVRDQLPTSLPSVKKNFTTMLTTMATLDIGRLLFICASLFLSISLQLTLLTPTLVHADNDIDTVVDNGTDVTNTANTPSNNLNNSPSNNLNKNPSTTPSNMADNIAGNTAGNITGKVAKNDTKTSIDSKVKDLKAQLVTIELRLSKQKDLTDMNDLLTKVDKIVSKIEKQKQQPSKPITATASSQQITETVQLSYNINKVKQSHLSYISQIEPGFNELEIIKQRLLTLQQLLINPTNQLDSEVSSANVQELIDISNRLLTKHQTTIEQESTLIDKADQAISTLETLQSNLLQKLEEKTESTQSPASNTEKIKQKIVTHEVALAQLRAELAKDKNQKSLSELQALQAAILVKQHELWLYNLDNELLQWIQPLTASLPVGQSMIVSEEELSSAYNEAVNVSYLIDEKIEEITARQKTLTDYTDVIGEKPRLNKAYKERLDNLKFLQLQINALQTRYDQRLSKQNTHNLFIRKKVFQETNFSTHVQNIPASLLKIGYQVKISLSQLFSNIVQNPWQILTVLAIMLLIIFIFKRLSRFRYGYELFEKNKEVNLIILLRKSALVLKKHPHFSTLCLFIFVLINFLKLPAPSYDIIMVLVSVIFGLLFCFAFSQLELALGVVKKNAALRSNFSITLLAVCILLYSLSSLSAVSQPLVDFYEKILMLGIAAAAWSSQRYIHTLIKHTNKDKNSPKSKTYISYIMFVSVVPIVIIITSLIGLIGYTQFSWMVLSYSLLLFVMYTLFTLGILLINTVRKQLKLTSIKQYELGVFFAQDIINPLSLLIKVLWLVFCSLVLLFFIGMWWSESLIFIKNIIQWVFRPLFSINKVSFNLFSMVMLIAAPFMVYRIGKWLRTFSFHWLFARVSDYGIRHSLSILSQYVATLIGVLVTLNIIGIDLTSFAVFAGALGVGVGLGLQDIAKNFISGILLLIERPLRQGDWVKVDGNEGFVKSIGLRAIILENFDKQEVIIPNGNAINNSLTNYTHSNQLNRTVLYVGVSYDCEPDKVHLLIGNILKENDAVLSNPGWEIILWEYADSAITYRLQYHIDLNQNERFTTQNAILKRIWYVFKEEGVEIPYPKRDVYLKNVDD